jgi:riboflavin synthase
MFTGLIETTGTITAVRRSDRSSTLEVKPDTELQAVRPGDSVAVDGVCLTIEEIRGGILVFTAVQETLLRTTLDHAVRGRIVNMERSVAAGGRFEGHIVLGHVDGIGKILSDRREGVSIVRTIGVPEPLRMFMAEKGSVAIDGISLTIASAGTDSFTVALIPHTIGKTTMQRKSPGDEVNLECDVIARYIHRMLVSGLRSDNDGSQGENRLNAAESLISRMERLGF